MTDNTDDFLAHYGVLGMKWGRRKSRSSVELVDSKTGKKVSVSYNPKNVSLSDSRGKVKISTSNPREAKKIQKQIDKSVGTDNFPVHKITGKASEVHADSAEAKSARLKASVNGLDSLSNKEVQAVVTRMNLEQQYLKLNPTTVSSGKQFLGDTARDTIKSEIKGGVKKATAAGVKAGFKAATGK